MIYTLVILCGGSSTRMGSDKALLPFGNCCLLEYLVHKFQPHFSKIYLSVKKKGDYAHLNLPVTEVPDLYPNAGPMSGVFSCLSMIDENKAFFMSVDLPFLEPSAGIALLNEIGDYDLCLILGKSGNLEISTLACSKSCIPAVGKCLLRHQFTIQSLREKCRTKYLTTESISSPDFASTDIQFFNLDTREDYYHALCLQTAFPMENRDHLICHPDLVQKQFSRPAPVLSFFSKPGIKIAPFLEHMTVLLKRNGLKVLFLTMEDKNMIVHNIDFPPCPESLAAACGNSDLIFMEYENMDMCPASSNKIEVLKKGWSETPLSSEPDSLLALLTDFPYQTDLRIPVFEMNYPKDFLQFLHRLIAEGLR